ncbi:hypothetical protein EXIGLDRAFT_759346 [Exidia glandulosa HHB12029]|uniref:Uncharacterized protein n=1 Tax=Exidia glandulosa HHB12029 TaxID=1314781 RepID=A0A166BPU5_EXIGL|nr:hypothetical protein EXIGLDRAFT_759346 [Exidia glandulosa HHB12029]
MAATVLSCFEVLPAKDEHGNGILPPKLMSSGVISTIAEFPCTFKLRSEEKGRVILEEFERAEGFEAV